MDELDRLRERDDVRRDEVTTEVDAEEFETIRHHHESGRDVSVGALVRDGEGRVALVRTHWSDGWVVPGGKVEPGEGLREAVCREVCEETGLDAVVERPLEVVEHEHVHGEESTSGYFVAFEVRTDDASLGDDLGEDDAEIEDAAWFREVPEESFDADLLDRHR